jgi:hypothetical protein
MCPFNFYYTTGGSYIEMRSRPDSATCKQLIINQTSAQYTTAGSFIEGPKSRCDARGTLRSVGQSYPSSLACRRIIQFASKPISNGLRRSNALVSTSRVSDKPPTIAILRLCVKHRWQLAN